MVNMVIGNESGYRSGDKTPPVIKMEIEDSLQEEHAPLNKRPRSMGMGGLTIPQPEYNPLDEPSPLGLRLRKSPSLLELIQMRLSEANAAKVGSQSHVKKELKGIATPGDRLKASNFPGSVLRIGSWEYKSRYEGDLVAKCYFAKHKLVWEVLDGGLKNKIEIQWSDIMGLKANYPDDGPGTLDVVLARQPLFFRETNPQPRKHTLWQATSDFTGGEASVHRRHYLECPPRLLGKHFEKLVQCDPRLNFPSQQGEITLDSPYFEPKIQAFDDQTCSNNDLDLNREGSPSLFSLLDNASPFAAQSSSSRNDVETLVRSTEFFTHETPSPSSAQHTSTVEDIKGFEFEHLKEASNWDQIMVPGLRSSMSMSDLVNHLEHWISEQGNTSNPSLSSEDWESLQMLDEINRCLFSDFNNMPESDDKSLLSRVNSLCCLLQKDTASCSNPPADSGTPRRINSDQNPEANPDQSMPRTDSVGDLLLNLPRIASLPQFLFNVSENFESQAR